MASVSSAQSHWPHLLIGCNMQPIVSSAQSHSPPLLIAPKKHRPPLPHQHQPKLHIDSQQQRGGGRTAGTLPGIVCSRPTGRFRPDG